MSLLLFPRQEIQCKIVYYGPSLCGKTTNLQYIHSRIPSNVKGKMIRIDTNEDKTLFFDFLSLDLGKVAGLSIQIQLYTVPGQVHYNVTRKLVLRGVDGVVFVADSLNVRRDHNIKSLQNLEEDLEEYGLNIRDIPLVMQYNRRDLEGRGIPILAVQDLERDLNAKLQVPSFPASAVEGFGVFDTLRAICKLVAKEVSRRALGRQKAASAL